MSSFCMSVSACLVSGLAATRATVECVESGTNLVEDMLALFSQIDVDDDGLLLLDGGMGMMMSAAASMVKDIKYDVAVLDKTRHGYLVVIGSRGKYRCGDLIPVRDVH